MGLYNSVTGLVTEPYKGAKTEGTVGFLKGIGKGSVGFVTKSGTGKSHQDNQGLDASLTFRSHVWNFRISSTRRVQINHLEEGPKPLPAEGGGEG